MLPIHLHADRSPRAIEQPGDVAKVLSSIQGLACDQDDSWTDNPNIHEVSMYLYFTLHYVSRRTGNTRFELAIMIPLSCVTMLLSLSQLLSKRAW